MNFVKQSAFYLSYKIVKYIDSLKLLSGSLETYIIGKNVYTQFRSFFWSFLDLICSKEDQIL